jgi:O-antigen/teichoic acid export membrane protein
LARLASVVASVVLVPVYTRYFSVADYGLVENLNVLTTIVVSVFSMAVPEALFRHFPSVSSDQERRAVLATCSLLSIVGGSLAAVAALGAGDWFGPVIIRRSRSESLVAAGIVGALAFATIQFGLLLALLRISLRRRDYLIATLGSLGCSLVISVACVVWLGWGPVAPFVGSALGTVLAYAWCVRKVPELLSFSAFDQALATRLLSFSLPLVPAALFLLVIRSSDRYFITMLLSDPLHQVGLYVTAEKVLAPLTLIGAGFAFAWTPFAMHASRQANAAGLFRAAFGYYVAATSVGVVALSAASRLVLRIITPSEYHGSYVYVPILGLYVAINSLHYIGSVGLFLAGRTRLGVPMLGVAAAVNLVLNLVLIPAFGVFGAAWATVIAFLAYDLLMFRTSERLLHVGFPFWRGMVAYASAYAGAVMVLGRPFAGVLALAVQIVLLLALGLIEKRVLLLPVAWARRRWAGPAGAADGE